MHPVIEQELLIEKVLGYITPHLAVLETKPKPTYLHSVRVGMYLYNRNYDIEIILAWFLHDMIEDTSVTAEEIRDMWGKDIVGMVIANTKNEFLPKDEMSLDMIQRCKDHSKWACIVKAVDLMDGLQHYIDTDNVAEAHSRVKKSLLLLKDLQYEDDVFDELRELVERIV